VKIVHVSWDIGAHLGGGERAVLAIVRAVRSHIACELAVITSSVDSICHSTIDGVPVTLVPSVFGPFDNPVPHVRILREVLHGADVIHVHQANTIMLDMVQLVKLRRQRLVVSDYGGGGPNFTRVFGRLTRVDCTLAYSEVLRRSVARICKHVEHIALPVDFGLFQILPGVEIVPRSVVSVGRILPHKGFELLIEALPSDFSLTIIGRPYDVIYFKYLKQVARGRAVMFMTETDDTELVLQLNQASVVVVPSVYVDYKGGRHREPELFGLVAVEAAACGRPVIVSTAVPALSAAIQDGVIIGSRYDWRSSSDLRAAILQRASTAVVEGNRKFVAEEYSSARIGEQMMRVYEGLVPFADR